MGGGVLRVSTEAPARVPIMYDGPVRQKLRLFVKLLHLLPFLYVWGQICAVHMPLCSVPAEPSLITRSSPGV